ALYPISCPVLVSVKMSRSIGRVSQLEAVSKKPDEQTSEPIKFSTSKASHRTWKVDRSMGSQFERPWQKVLPISLIFTAFLIWCALRGSDDEHLDKPLHESLPSLRPDEDKPGIKPS
uniref:Uncharacterized protein n=1 Tax=Neogobius melanostomus TaxID=47308 RepID=A0A8C6UJG8_9GOBI